MSAVSPSIQGWVPWSLSFLPLGGTGSPAMSSLSLQTHSVAPPSVRTGPTALLDMEQGTQGPVHCTPALFYCELVCCLGTNISHAAPVVLGTGALCVCYVGACASCADLLYQKSLHCMCLTGNWCAMSVLVGVSASRACSCVPLRVSAVHISLGAAPSCVPRWESLHRTSPAGSRCIRSVLLGDGALRVF